MYNVQCAGWLSVSDDTERLVADIDEGLKARAKADPRTIREIVESALQREFMTGATAAVERRLEEKRSRKTQLEQERNERERELAEVEDDIQRLQRQLETHEEKHEQELREARDALEHVPREADNPAVKNWADKLGMTPNELLKELD